MGTSQREDIGTIKDRLAAGISLAGAGPTTPALASSVAQAQSTTLVTGQKAVTNTAAALASSASYKNGIKLTCLATSTAPLYYGPSGVTATGATGGDELPAGTSVILPIADPAAIFVIAAANSTTTLSFAGLP